MAREHALRVCSEHDSTQSDSTHRKREEVESARNLQMIRSERPNKPAVASWQLQPLSG